MHTTNTDALHFANHATTTEHAAQTRLDWLIAADVYETQRRRLFRSAREEMQMQLMRRPVATRQAFASLGWLLGLLPPAAIFYRLFGYGFGLERDSGQFTFFLLCLLMNAACCVAGRLMGLYVGRFVDDVERRSWSFLLVASMLMGMIWGVGAGGLGGMLFFGFGALFGAVCAVPVGMLAFMMFAPLHRSLARGGMMEACHLWPLACGVTMFIVALILSPHVFPY